MALSDDIKKFLILSVTGLAFTTLVGWSSGYVQVARSAKAFFASEGELVSLRAAVKASAEHETEIQAMIRDSKTLSGYAEIFQSDKSGALVSARSRYRNGDVILVENIGSDEGRRTETTVIGSFTSRDDLILRVSPDVGRILGFTEGRIRAEVRPAN